VSLLLELSAPLADTDKPRAPGTLQVVLDRSGSMAGGALESAKDALFDLVGRLEPTDHFGLVVFDDEVQIAVPAAPLTDKEVVRALIRCIPPGGTTNLSGGYLRGLQEARRVAGDGGATLLLLSDGHANVGITDSDKLGAVAVDGRSHRVTTSTIGLGLGYDESLLAALARGGAGNTYFAEEGDTAAAALASEVDGLLERVVQAASLTVRPTGAVESITLFNDLATVGVDDGFMVELGDFMSGEQRKLLLEIEVPAMAALGLAQVCELELQWVELATMSTQKVTIPVHVNVVPGDEAAGRVANATVRTERAFQQAQRDKQRATDALRAGNAAAAAQIYAGAAEALGGFADGEMQEEVRALYDLAERAQFDDASRTAKLSEADRHRKSRRRG